MNIIALFPSYLRGGNAAGVEVEEPKGEDKEGVVLIREERRQTF